MLRRLLSASMNVNALSKHAKQLTFQVQITVLRVIRLSNVNLFVEVLADVIQPLMPITVIRGEVLQLLVKLIHLFRQNIYF